MPRPVDSAPTDDAHPIVLVGSLGDSHVHAIHERLCLAGRNPYVLDAQAFPAELRISVGDGDDDISIGGTHLPRPAAVYVRSLYQSPSGYGVDAEQEMHEDWRRTLIKYHERNTLLTSILYRWEESGVPLYNPLSAQKNITKPYQLALLSRAGLPVPRTLWSNDPDEVRQFAARGPTIYKPVSGGAATQQLQENDLTPDRLRKLSAAPVTFQELLTGEDIRVFVIDGRVVARLRIVTDALDFRQNEEAVETVTLPKAVDQQCIDAARILGLRFTGMDLKADAAGTLRILELNASAMFLGFDQLAGTDVAGSLTDALMAH
jgi:glutathione synthase/RimK-type ligase-like ATP-grasp enzyme